MNLIESMIMMLSLIMLSEGSVCLEAVVKMFYFSMAEMVSVSIKDDVFKNPFDTNRNLTVKTNRSV